MFLVTDCPLFPSFTVFTMFPEIRVRIYLPRRLVVRCLLFPVGSVAPHLLGVLKKKKRRKVNDRVVRTTNEATNKRTKERTSE